MQFAFVRELRVRRRRGFGIDLLAMTLTAALALTALAQDISPATKRLFDAVWADDLGRVKAAITAGASISAVNELGVRPVDMAVDRGHYEIAHYLLSVEKQRRDAATQEPVSKPAERALASTVTPAPTSSLPGSGWLVGSTATRQTTPTAAPAAVPATAASPVPPLTPTAIARPAPSALPTAQEQLWSPDTSGEKSSLQVVSVAKPQPIVAPASSAGSINDAPVPQVKPRSESGSGGQSPDWLNRVTDLFKFSEKETAPTTPASPSNIAAVGSEEPAPKAAVMDQPSQTASARPRNVASNPAAREEQAEPVKSETSEVSESKTSPLASGSDTATTDIGRMFSRIADVFRPSPIDDSAPNTSDLTTVEPANNPPTAPTPAPKVLETAATPAVIGATDTAPDDTTVRQIMSDAPSDAPPAPAPVAAALEAVSPNEDPGWLTRLRNAFEPASVGTAEGNAAPTSAADADGVPEPAPELKRLAEPTVVVEAPAITEEPVPQSLAAEVAVADQQLGSFEQLPNILTPDVSDTMATPEVSPDSMTSEVVNAADAEPNDAAAKPEVPPDSVTLEVADAADTEPNDTSVRQIISDAPSDPPSVPALLPIWPTGLREAFESASVGTAEGDAALTSAADADGVPKPEPRSNVAPSTVSAEAINEPVASPPEEIARPTPSPTTVETPTAAAPETAAVAPPDAEALATDSGTPNLFQSEETENAQAAAPAQPVKPAAIAHPTPSALPTAQEQLWSPGASVAKSSLQVVSVAKPQPIVTPARLAGPINDALDPAPATPASPSNIAAVGSEELAPKAAATDQPSQAASAPFQDAVSNPAVREEQADRVKLEMTEMPEDKTSPPLSSEVVGAPAASAQVAALLQGGGTTTGGNSARVSSSRGSAAPLADVRLTLFEDQGLGRRMPAPGVGQCVNKIRWNTVYCIEPLAWLSDLASAFNISSNFYRGPKSIVEYVAGRSVQIHVLFNTEEIQRVTKHFTGRYGRPTEQPEIWTDLIGRKKRPNRTLRWRNRDSKTGEVTVLEIREIDDLRWSSPPDTRHGALRIYTEKRGSVFKLLSWTDLLLVQLRRRR